MAKAPLTAPLASITCPTDGARVQADACAPGPVVCPTCGRWLGVALRAVAVLLVALLAGCASGGAPSPAPAPDAPTATLAVVVTDAGQPVPGAVVDVSHTATPDAQTNGDGYAALPVPAAVPLTVQVRADGYADWTDVVTLDANAQLVVALTRLVTPPWPGRLQVGPGARCFVDGEGRCQLPVLAHFGEAFSAYTRRPDAVRAQLQAIKRAGYDGLRTWDTLGYYEVWRGREVFPWAVTNRAGQRVPATPDYDAVLEAFVRDVQAAGLVLHHSRGDLNGQPLSRVVEHAERVAAIYDRVGWDVLVLAEGNNEDWQNGNFEPGGLRQIAAPFAARGAITALSSPPETSEEPALIRAYSADVFYVHGHRQGGHTDILRHIFSLSREAASGTPRLGWQGEPAGPGPGVTVGQVNDAEALALMAAQSVMARQAWTYMSSHGVFWDGPLEAQPGFAAVPRLVAALEAFAPDLMSWALTHRSAPDAVLTSVRPATEEARIDQALAPDGRVVALVYDPTGTQTIRVAQGRPLACEVIGLADDETLTRHPVTLDAGGTLTLTYRVGRVLVCTPMPTS